MNSRGTQATGLRSKLDVYRVLRAYGLVEAALHELSAAARERRAANLLPLRRSLQEFVRLPDTTRLLQLATLSLEPRDATLAARLTRIGLTVALMSRRLGLGVAECRDVGTAAAVAGIGRALGDELVFADVETCVTCNVFVEGVRWLASVSSPTPPASLRLTVAIEQASGQTRRSGHPASRLTAVADRYDLLCHPEPHGKGLRGDVAIEEMQGAPDIDPVALRALTHTVGRYPIGCPVKLTSGESAVVVDVPLDPARLDVPRVVVAAEGKPRTVIDLAEGSVRIESSLDRNQLKVDMSHFLFA